MAPQAKRAKSSAKPSPTARPKVNASPSNAKKPVNPAASASSSDESENESDESELDLDEEVSGSDVAEESDSDEEASDSDSDDESNAKPFSDHFDTALTSILGSKIKAHDASNPVLIRNKRTAKEIDEAREDRKVRRALRAEKQQFKDKARVKQVIPKDPELAGEAISREKTLRKTAQRGVVKLLNAINSAQSAALSAAGEGRPDRRQAQASTEVSKEKFLDMIRMG